MMRISLERLLQTPADLSDSERETYKKIYDDAFEILERVRRDEIHPFAAEEWAKERGVGPFERRPDPSTFEPMKCPDWTSLMAIAWIATRDLERVRDFAPDFCHRWTVWVERDPHFPSDEPGKICRGYTLELLTGADGPSYELLLGEGKEAQAEIEKAKADLWEALSTGKLVARGYPRGGGNRIDLPKIGWSELYFQAGEPGNFLRSEHGESYKKVIVSREDVLSLWPANAAAQARENEELLFISTPSPTLTVDAIDLEVTTPKAAPISVEQNPKASNVAVRKWMQNRVATWPDEKLAPSEAEDWKAVQNHFSPGLSRDEFRMVRKEETPLQWRQQGPRKQWGDVRSRNTQSAN